MNFAEVEQVVAKLRQDLAAGRLTEEQFKARLRELMVQDEQGNWWMVGYETGEWYRHDGTDWVPDHPPLAQPVVRQRMPAWVWGVVGAVVVLLVAVAVLDFRPDQGPEPGPTPMAVAQATATPTPTAIPLPPKPTEEPTLEPTVEPTEKPTPTATPVPATPTFTHPPPLPPGTPPTATLIPPTDTLTSPPPTPTFTPQQPPAPSATPTFTPTPPLPPSLTVENAEGYDSDATLNATYQINDAWGANEGSLSLAGLPHIGGGTRAIAFWFNIRNPASADYCGFERHLSAAQDWSGYSHLCLWVENDGSIHEMVVQFGEKSGEVWKCTAALPIGAQELCLPLSGNIFYIAEWSSSENGQIDLGAISYYGIYVHRSHPGSGIIYIDEIRVVNR